jgi:hypothetical protein
LLFQPGGTASTSALLRCLNLEQTIVRPSYGFLYDLIYCVLLSSLPRCRGLRGPRGFLVNRNHIASMLPTSLKEFLQRLTPPTRSNLLNELERLELAGAEIPGAAPVVETLRAEFRGNDQAEKRKSLPARYFFAPLEPLLVGGAPEHSNIGAIERGSLPAIWEWISRDLLPTMARDYTKQVTELLAVDKQKEARQAASVFQTKVLKSMESNLGSPELANQIRDKLATYTASRAVYADLTKMLSVLRARDDLTKLADALPAKIKHLEGAELAKVMPLLDRFAKTHPEQVPFALTLIAGRLKTSWELIRLATKTAPTKNAPDVASAPYAVAVQMALDGLEDRRTMLSFALKNERVLVAKELLIDIYDTEYALQVRIDNLAESDWGRRLQELMASISALVESEVSRFPDNVGHILGSRRLRSHNSLSGRVTFWAWKGRDVVNDGLAAVRRMTGVAEKSRA